MKKQFLLTLLTGLAAISLLAQKDKSSEQDAIRKVIEEETTAIQLCDYERWANHWWHETYCYFSITSPGEHTGLQGWDAISEWGKNLIKNCKPTKQNTQRDGFHFSIIGNMAFVTFLENWGNESTRVLEKRDGKWKLIRMGVVITTAYDALDDTLTVEHVKDNIWLLSHNSACNVGVYVSNDGLILVDDRYWADSEKIRVGLSKISHLPVKYIINTHWHADHSEGNENFARTGSIIVAHENSRKRLTTDQFISIFNMTIPARTWEGLPSLTFTQEFSFHELGGETIHLFHVPNAHTDGDAVIHFKTSNVIHTGDLVTWWGLPFIDIEHGGSINGYIDGVERILSLCDGETKIVPGHGKVGSKQELEDYLQMLKAIRDKVAKGIEKGLTLEQIVAEKPASTFSSFFSADEFVKMVYQGVKK